MISDLERCDREIARVRREAFSGNPDVEGILLAIKDWNAERELIYREFLQAKAQEGSFSGFDPVWMPSFPFDFQVSQIDWTLRKGKSLLAADCGMGKTVVELVWAENVVRKTNRPVLILTPLAVSQQMIREAGKFGVEAHRTRDGKVFSGINITNYERLHYYRPEDCVWDDIRGNTGTKAAGVLPFRDARDEEDEKHVHPLQLDVISRCVELWSNPGEKLLTPFMGVGSEVYAAVRAGRKGIGVELKPSYYRQAIENLKAVEADTEDSEQMEFAHETQA